jgi:hypothetical protein
VGQPKDRLQPSSAPFLSLSSDIDRLCISCGFRGDRLGVSGTQDIVVEARIRQSKEAEKIF